MRPAAANGGWIYRDTIAPRDLRGAPAPTGWWVSHWYAARYGHSSRNVWLARLAAGEIEHNGHRLAADALLTAGDQLAWHRSPWIEPAVPDGWEVLHDDGDLHVIAKPEGLPVLPAGGFLEHTMLRLLERRHAADPAGVPRPVHRLGRFTSGVLVCARRPATRAWLSQRLRDSTAATCSSPTSCRKLYRALVEPGCLPLAPGGRLEITAPIGRRPHPRLGWVWCLADPADPHALPARSGLRLLQRRREGDLVEVLIASGRPHQIRIHCAASGAPLLGDPLYGCGGLARSQALPGDGGYRLHALAVGVRRPDGSPLELTAPPPPPLMGP
ncbi:MAG: pseudouridine synthase [Cyanobacteriota bacterium]|nr:pseudouridine synthase [Cyanobacteriota bacterium]